MTTERPRTRSCKARAVRGILRMAVLLLATGLAGCSYLFSDKLPYTSLSVPYDRTQLKTSTTLDVLNLARAPEYQFPRSAVEAVLLTQSDTVVGYSGRSQDGRKTWLNMVVFDEFRMTAKRKYFFCVDEEAESTPGKSHQCLFPPRKVLLFDSEFAIDPEIRTTPFATEETQRIALVRWLARQFDADVAVLTGGLKSPTQGNEYILASGMMVRQMFQGILAELDKSPDLARSLSEEQGARFPHISLKEGRIRLLVEGDLATATVRVNLPMTPPPR